MRAPPALLAALIACAGCSTTATIHRRSGPPVEAKILGGTPDAIVIRTWGNRGDTIPRSEILDIDHPGNVHAVAGGALTGYGAFNIAVGAPTCTNRGEFGSDAEQYAFCAGVFAPLTVGSLMLLWGWLTHDASTGAAADRSFRVPEAAPAR